MKLENRRAIVTGAAQGLGYAIAKRLNEEGCRVAMLDINEEKVCAAAAELKDCFGAKCKCRQRRGHCPGREGVRGKIGRH